MTAPEPPLMKHITESPHHGLTRRGFSSCGFTLLEILVAMALLVLLFGMLLKMTEATSRIWRTAATQATPFREAREAFDSITAQLGQVTLQPYWDYEMNGDIPSRYVTQSDLHFLMGHTSDILGTNKAIHPAHGVFFQKTGGEDQAGGPLKNLLETAGFFVETGDCADYVPTPMKAYLKLSGKSRMRLVEVLGMPKDSMIYGATKPGSTTYSTSWIDALNVKDPAARGAKFAKRIAADNVILLVLRARLPEQEDSTGDSLSPNYSYDSRLWEKQPGAALAEKTRNQLPPIIDVVLVAIDEASAERLSATGRMNPEALGLGDLFLKADNDSLEKDLKTLEKQLLDFKLTYRVFRASVRVSNARWGEA